jgi:hypothetical protein
MSLFVIRGYDFVLVAGRLPTRAPSLRVPTALNLIAGSRPMPEKVKFTVFTV